MTAERQTPTFDGLAPEVCARVAAAAIPCRFRAKQTLFHAGMPADALYFIISGRVRVARETPERVELLHTEGAGGVLAEIPVFGGGVFPATAIATESTHCLKLPVDAVQRLLRDEPAFVNYALKRLTVRAQTLLRRIDQLTASTIPMRVAAHIARRAQSSPFTLGMTQSELAEEMGTAREVVVRAIAALVRARAVRRVGRSRFEVVSWAVLRAMCGPLSD